MSAMEIREEMLQVEMFILDGGGRLLKDRVVDEGFTRTR